LRSFRTLFYTFLACIVAPLTAAEAQFTNEVAIERDGVRIFVRPSVSIATTSTGVVQVRLTQIHARVDESYGVVVNGQRYAYTAFNRGLVSFFTAIRVQSLSLGITFDGVQGCSGRVGLASWREGGLETLSCNSGSTARITGYTVNGLSTSGVLELQAEVRRLVAEERRAEEARARQARADSIARVQQARADSIARVQQARADSIARAQQTAAQRAPQPFGMQASASATATNQSREQASREQAARDQAAANQRAEVERRQAQATLDQITRDNELAKQRLEAGVQQLAGSVMEISNMIAANRAAKAAREERARVAAAEAARRAEATYQSTIAARFAATPDWRACGEADIVRIDAAEFVQTHATLGMRSCRNADGKALAVIDIAPVSDGRWTLISAYGTGRGLVSAHASTEAASAELFSQTRRGGVIQKLPPGSSRHRVLLTTEARGEEVPYVMTVQAVTRSTPSASRWLLHVGFGSSSETRGGTSVSGAVFNAQGGMRLLAGAYAVGELGMDAEGNNQFVFGGRYIVGRDSWAVRPFAQYDIISADDGTVSSTASGYSIGAHWIPTVYLNEAAITLEWISRTGTLTQAVRGSDAYSQSGLRFGFTLFPSPRPQ
jgi:hypothetical protein